MANMLPRTTTEKQKDMHVVKIAVELESKVPQLTKFDRRTPLTGTYSYDVLCVLNRSGVLLLLCLRCTSALRLHA